MKWEREGIFMELVRAYLEEVKEKAKGDFKAKKEDGYAIVSYLEKTENGGYYQVSVSIYDNDDDVVITVSRQLGYKNRLSLLDHINQLNIAYCGITFFVEGYVASLKVYCKAGGDLSFLQGQIPGCLDIAVREFGNL
jgi:hypothetical protein